VIAPITGGSGINDEEGIITFVDSTDTHPDVVVNVKL
jgi:hypothetical protein